MTDISHVLHSIADNKIIGSDAVTADIVLAVWLCSAHRSGAHCQPNSSTQTLNLSYLCVSVLGFVWCDPIRICRMNLSLSFPHRWSRWKLARSSGPSAAASRTFTWWVFSELLVREKGGRPLQKWHYNGWKKMRRWLSKWEIISVLLGC